MVQISKAVGPRRSNLASDVATVQTLLNQNIKYLIPARLLAVDGKFAPPTEALIRAFQQRVLGMAKPDGVISPDGPTLRRLVAHTTPMWKIQAAPAAAKPLVTKKAPKKKASSASSDWGVISEEQYTDAARRLGCETACVKAVVETEVGIRSPFDSQKRPTILFERHIFHRLTNGKYDKNDESISNKDRGKYGKYSEQYGRLDRAAKFDRDAALMSASWGAFQIMGENYKQAGFDSIDAFVAAMKESIQAQLEAFVTFCTRDARLRRALQKKDWTTFARIYNGPDYKSHDYDGRMKQNYEKLVKGV